MTTVGPPDTEEHSETGDGVEGAPRWHFPRHHVGAAALGFGLFLVVLAAHGFWLGQTQPTGRAHLARGAIDCLREQGLGALTDWCPTVGAPVGQPLISGLPQTYAGLLISYLPFVNSMTAHVWVQILCDAVGFVGMFLVVRRIGAHPVAAVVAAFTYLASLQVVYINGFAATFDGFVLIPAYVACAILALDHLRASDPWWRSWLVLFVSATVMAFTDGYAFIMSSLTAACLWLVWTFDSELDVRRRVIAWACLASASISAVAVYIAYVPSGGYDSHASIDFFRAMGADVVTLLAPQETLWWADIFGFGVDFSHGWGDASAWRANYLGYFALGLALFGFISTWRMNRLVSGLALAGCISLILALGPSLKVYERYERDLAAEPTAYLMPSEEAAVGLPTTVVYEHLPGFSEMRATYRWVTVTVFALYALGAVGASSLYRRHGIVLALAVGMLAVVEVLPNLDHLARAYQGQRAQMELFDAGPQIEIRSLVRPDETVLFLPAANDLLVNDLVGGLDLQVYNIGIDKNWFLSSSRWPVSVNTAVAAYSTPEGPDAVAELLRNDADVVVFPHFNLRDNALVWPPSPDIVDKYINATTPYTTDPRLSAEVGTWFTTVRLR